MSGFSYSLLLQCVFSIAYSTSSDYTFDFQNTAGPGASNNFPVCVVGAGISGLNLGILLRAKGHRVELFEEKERVGGKINTYREGNSVIIDKAAFFITTADRTVMSYINRFQLETDEFNRDDVVLYDQDNGSIQPIPALPTEAVPIIEDALGRYVEYYNGYSRGLDTGYLNASPDLFFPFSLWADAHNLSALVPLFGLPITGDGYGHLDDIPALYVLKLMNPERLASLILGGPNTTDIILTLRNGLGPLMSRMAESLDVYLKHRVTSITRRDPEFQEIGFENPELPVRQCRKVILAFPPLLKNVGSIVSDLSSTERELLSQVKVHKYTSAGHHTQPLDHALYFEGIRHPDLTQPPIPLISPVGNGEVVGMLKQSNGGLKNVYSSYSWIRGDYDSEATPAEVQIIGRKLEGFLRMISPNPRLFFFENHQYFPHVTTSSLQDGFYQKFEHLQGNNGLYYATPLLTFELMEYALQMTEYFVNKYF